MRVLTAFAGVHIAAPLAAPIATICVAAVLILVVAVSPVRAADPHRGGATTWQATVCQKGHVLGLIKSEFNRAQTAVFDRDIAITELYDPRLDAERFMEPLYHNRAYCMARALLSNGRHHSVFYKVSNDWAPPLGNGIEWCVVGYDDMHAYSPDCAQLRPF